MPLVQDHKRAYEGDVGPNTGGMGSYSDANHMLPFLKAAHHGEALAIMQKTIDAFRKKTGKPFVGVLYGGFMATAQGVKLIEYNSRFGDPEAMNVLSILEGDLFGSAPADVGWKNRQGAEIREKGDCLQIPCARGIPWQAGFQPAAPNKLRENCLVRRQPLLRLGLRKGGHDLHTVLPLNRPGRDCGFAHAKLKKSRKKPAAPSPVMCGTGRTSALPHWCREG